MKMIDFLRIRTFSQSEILNLRGLELVLDYPIQGWECLKLNDRVKLRLKPLYQDGEFIGYAFADLSIQPHFIFNNGVHNGNDFTPTDCILTLNKIFEDLRIQDLAEFQIIGIEFGVNVVPETEIKEIINSIKYWKRKPFKRNKADFSLITDSTAHKQVKVYAKGIDAIERLKTDEVHPNAFRFEIKSKERKFLNLTALDLFDTEVYEDFQRRIVSDLNFTLFVSKPQTKKGLSIKEKRELKELTNPDSWTAYLNDKNRDKFNYQRKKYERIMAKIPNVKSEIKELIEAKFYQWQNSAFSTKKIKQKKADKNQTINKLNEKNSAFSTSHARARAFYTWNLQKK